MTAARPVRVLVAEDEVNLGAILEQFLTARGHQVTLVSDGAQALAALRSDPFDVALLDIVMPHMDGLEVLRSVREGPAGPEVIMITGNGTVDTAIAAMRLGAFDYLAKPYRMAEIDLLVGRASEKRELARENAALHSRLQSVDPLPQLVTSYPPLRAIMATLERIAPSATPVLISGESGTGKEIVARSLHHLSGRGRAPLVDVACAAIGGGAMEGELFGHEGGAFGGSSGGPFAGTFAGGGAPRAGPFELAAGGTLFMDEIAALDPRLQGALLRVLEQGVFHRVGGGRHVAATARLISATNKDLGALVASGAFRDDLLYRINTVHVSLPPLRERRCDVPALAQHFLERFGGSAPPRITAEALAALEQHEWPGNVRELRNVIERAVLLCSDGEVSVRDLTIPVPGLDRRSMLTRDERLDSLQAVECDHIRFVLERTRWHQGRAAEILGISSKTLYRKIREFGFDRPTDYQNSA